MNETQRESGEPRHWSRHQNCNWATGVTDTDGSREITLQLLLQVLSHLGQPSLQLRASSRASSTPSQEKKDERKRRGGRSVFRGKSGRWTWVEAEGLACNPATVLLPCCSFRPKPLTALRPVPALKGAIMHGSSTPGTVCCSKSEWFLYFQFRFHYRLLLAR